jgi:hypothetical protein
MGMMFRGIAVRGASIARRSGPFGCGSFAFDLRRVTGASLGLLDCAFHHYGLIKVTW